MVRLRSILRAYFHTITWYKKLYLPCRTAHHRSAMIYVLFRVEMVEKVKCMFETEKSSKLVKIAYLRDANCKFWVTCILDTQLIWSVNLTQLPDNLSVLQCTQIYLPDCASHSTSTSLYGLGLKSIWQYLHVWHRKCSKKEILCWEVVQSEKQLSNH